MKIVRAFALMVAVAAAGPAIAQTTIAQLAWMAGQWKQVSDGETVHESWVGPQGKTMAGVSLSHSERSGTSFEFMRIVESAEGLSFWAAPNGRPPTEFKLKESGEQRVVFEDPQREFPQRITYWREGAVLRARIEGTKQGRPLSFDWKYERAAAPAN